VLTTFQQESRIRLETTTEERGGIKIPEKLSQLRAKLGQKAKQEPKFRFYTLYGHLTRDETLETAWKQVKRNSGAAGMDGVTVLQVESQEGGVKTFLEEIKTSLITRTYRASPVKRVYIPKSDGRMRPLGIPVLKDRVIQAALLLIIEPIYEADFQECSYGFRPNRSAHDAIEDIRKHMHCGKREVYDGDLQGYFDSIPHDKLMKAVEARIVDARVLKLICMWLKAPVWEPGKPMQRSKGGTPQGGVISPLLANIFLNWFDKLFYGRDGPGTWAKAQVIRYADDFVILARYLTPKIVEWIERTLEGRFGLKINREKTKVVDLNDPKTKVKFLGYDFRWAKTRKDPQKRYCQLQASHRAVQKAMKEIRRRTSPALGCTPVKDVVQQLNLFLRGWGQYFCRGVPSKTFSKINWYVERRMSNFLKRRSQRGYKQHLVDGGWYAHFRKLGLMVLTKKAFSVNA
jgi:RNA-directed DNA polymerase